MKCRSRYQFFERIEGAPEPLSATVRRKLQFHEMDPANIAWHGQYPAFFEQAQAELGKICGLTYPKLREAGIIAPVRQFHAEYFKVLSFDEEFTVTASLIWSDGARVNIEYLIKKTDGSIAGAGYTVQLFMDPASGEALLADPEFWADFKTRWQNGEFSSR